MSRTGLGPSIFLVFWNVTRAPTPAGQRTKQAVPSETSSFWCLVSAWPRPGHKGGKGGGGSELMVCLG